MGCRRRDARQAAPARRRTRLFLSRLLHTSTTIATKPSQRNPFTQPTRYHHHQSPHQQQHQQDPNPNQHAPGPLRARPRRPPRVLVQPQPPLPHRRVRGRRGGGRGGLGSCVVARADCAFDPDASGTCAGGTGEGVGGGCGEVLLITRME